MKMAVWDSESKGIQNFIQVGESFAEMVLYEALEDILEDDEETPDLVVIDYDADKSACDKFVKKLRKVDEEVKILVLSNVLSPKQLVKHQNSKSGADIYLRTPVTADLLKSIFDPFFDIEIEIPELPQDALAQSGSTASDELNDLQTQVLKQHEFKENDSQDADKISEEIQAKFNIVFPESEDHATSMLKEIEKLEQEEEKEKNNPELEEISLEDDESSSEGTAELDISLDDDSEDDLLLDDSEDVESEDDLLLDDSEDVESEDDLLLDDSEDVESEDDLLLDDSEDIEGEDDDLLLDDSDDKQEVGEESEQNEISDQKIPGSISEAELPIDENDTLDLASDGEAETVDVINDEIDLDEADDAQSLEMANDESEQSVVEVVNDEIELNESDDSEELEIASKDSNDQENIVEVVNDEISLEETNNDDQLEMAGHDESSEVVTEVVNDEIDLGNTEDDSFELSQSDEQPQTIEVVSDEIDLDNPPENENQNEKVQKAPPEISEDREVAMSNTNDDENLELGQIDDQDEALDLTDEGIDLSDEDSMDLDDSSEELDLSEDIDQSDEEGLDLADDGAIDLDEDALDLDEDDSGEQLLSGDEIEDDQGLDLADEDALEFGDEQVDESLDDEGENSLELADDMEEGEDLNLDQVADVEEDIDELEFGVNEDNVDDMIDDNSEINEQEENTLSAGDLPDSPDAIEDLQFGQGDEGDDSLEQGSNVTDKDLTFQSGQTQEHSDDVMAKLAEIDSMMEEPPKEEIKQDATGEHEVPPELHAEKQMEAIDDMTEIVPPQTPDEDKTLDDIGRSQEEISEVEDEVNEINEQQQFADDVGDDVGDDLSYESEEAAEIESEHPEAHEQESIEPTEQSRVEPPKDPFHEPAGDAVKEHHSYKQHHGEELTRYSETIKSLRDEREDLIAEIEQLREKNNELKRGHTDMKAQLDERTIELSIVKKRHEKQVDELKYQLDISNDKKEVLEEKNKQFEKEYENLNRKIKVDLNKVRSKERDLENKLEMLRSDAEVQIRNRDQKILELKRKIDTLQFDVESIQVKEKKVVTDHTQLEDKMEKVIRTLRRAIGELEEDGSSIRSLEEIKKNLDV